MPKPGLREANSIEADDKEGAVAAYYQQYGYGAAQQQQGYYGQQQAGKGPAVLVSAQVGHLQIDQEWNHFTIFKQLCKSICAG